MLRASRGFQTERLALLCIVTFIAFDEEFTLSAASLDQLRIIHYPDARLKQPCAAISEVNDSIRALATRMLELMRAEDGIGLAAPQVGVLQRLFVCSVPGDEKDGKRRDLVFINPVLQDFEGEEVAEEGCLSIPDVLVRVRRPAKCTITGKDLDGKEIALRGSDLMARCWQHECDHLDGKLITDRMTEVDRIANRKALKRLESRR